MKLNHEIYKEAMDSIRLSDETGLKLIDEAFHRKAQRKQKQKLQAAAAIAAILITSLGINGICYAQTGMNVIEMFTSAFNNGNSDQMEAFAEGAKESGESFTYGNLKFTLEYYWYDKEGAELFYAIRTSSLDKTPLDYEQISLDYSISPTVDIGGWRFFEPVFNEDKTSYLQYYYIDCAYDNYGKPMDTMGINVRYDRVDAVPEDSADIGTFKLTPTGTMKTRYADCSILNNCSEKARITGTGIRMRFNEPWTDDGEPFNLLDIVMEDGTIYRSEYSEYYSPEQAVPIYNGEGELLNPEEIAETVPEYVTDPSKIRKCPIRSAFRNGDDNMLHDASGDLHEWTVCTVIFGDFIEVNDISAIYIDGVEIPLE